MDERQTMKELSIMRNYFRSSQSRKTSADRDAIKTLFWLVAFPAGTYAIMLWMEGSIADINSLHFLFFTLFLVEMTAADQLLKYARFEPDNGLVYIRRRFEGLAMGLAMLALISYPGVFRQQSELNNIFYAFAVFVFIAAVVTLYHLAMISSRKFVFKKLLMIGVRIISGSALLAILTGFVVGMTWAQILWFFMVVLGVLSNMIFPGNTRLAAKMARATPVAKRINRFVERLAFASGMTLLVTLPSAVDGGRTAGDILLVAVVIFLGHWVFTRHRDEGAAFQHR